MSVIFNLLLRVSLDCFSLKVSHVVLERRFSFSPVKITAQEIERVKVLAIAIIGYFQSVSNVIPENKSASSRRSSVTLYNIACKNMHDLKPNATMYA